MPKRKIITSELIDFSPSYGEISPVRRTVRAPNSIICQMRSFVPPTCLKAIRVKTVANVSTEMFSWNICNRS
jgi:hypothetical protein